MTGLPFNWLIATIVTGSLASEPKTVVVTGADHDHTVTLRPGDTLVVKLPMVMPVTWAIEKDPKVIKLEKGFPRIEQSDRDQGTQPAGSVPKLGGPTYRVHRYNVISTTEKTVTCEWMYCKLGKPDSTRRWLEENHLKAPEFRAKLKPSELREGMIYRIKLKIVPS